MAYQPKSYRKFIAGAATAAVVVSGFAGVAGAASNLSDIADNGHKEAIDSLVGKGIIKGFPDGTFKPYSSIKRGDAAVMVARTLNLLNGNNIPSSGFGDLNNVNAETKEAIAKLANLGIVSGFGDGSFRPNETITRAQMAKYVAQAFNLPKADGITKFTDVNPDSALAQFVDALADAGITQGKNDGTFGYHDNLNRGDFSAMIYRALTKTPPKAENPLTIKGDDQGDKLTNGSAKTYTVTLVNPVSGKPVEGAILNVTFDENLDTDFGPQRKATVTNSDNQEVIPYQSKDGQEAAAEIKTNKDGKATFTVTGTNTTVTPIVFLDGSYQEWDTKGGVLPQTQDNRFDKQTELYAYAAPLTFGVTEYNITVEGKRTSYAAIADEVVQQERAKHQQHVAGYENGREYVITVKKADGTPFAGGKVNVGIEQFLDGKLGNEPVGAYFTKDSIEKANGDFVNEATPYNPLTSTQRQAYVTLDSAGQATVRLTSTAANDSAKPIVWIDQNFDNNAQNYTLEAGEPVSDQSKVSPTNFQPARVDDGTLGAKLQVVDFTDAARKYFTGSFDNVEDVKGFNLTLLNQSGEPFLPDTANRDGKKARLTFEVVNTGAFPIRVHTADYLGKPTLKNAVLADYATGTGNDGSVVDIQVGGRVTIAGDIQDWFKWFDANSAAIAVYSVDGNSSVQVKASAVVDGLAGSESQSVAVNAGPVSYNLNNSSTAPELRNKWCT